ncbi:MAG: zinc-binding dehydrogenase [Actinobacteria bacterium]|nr:zinc-binding dehydrogenase [Actinomycetota bacterium]
MKRVAKPAGKFNIQIEDAPMPAPGPQEIRIRAVRTLISRGSEIGRRYTREEAIDPEMMGYSLAGVVDAVGPGVDHYAVGDRVSAIAPHAEFTVRKVAVRSPLDQPHVYQIPKRVTFDQAPYHPLVSSAVGWVDLEQIRRDDTVVIVGQGLVGSLILQVAKANGQGRLIAVDALASRCARALEFGADAAIDSSQEDPVRAVQRLTNGVGAEIVVYAVGGPAGPRAFEQAVEMVATYGLLHLIGLYEGAPLPLHSSKIQRRRILGGYCGRNPDTASGLRAMQLLAMGAIHADRMTSHHFPYTRAAEAFDLLYNRLGEAMGVILDWDT